MVYFLALIEVEILFLSCHGFKPVATQKKIATKSRNMVYRKSPNDSLLQKILKETETSSDKIETFVKFVRITIVFLKQAQK